MISIAIVGEGGKVGEDISILGTKREEDILI